MKGINVKRNYRKKRAACTNTRKVSVSNGIITFTLLHDNTKYYFTFNTVLLEILKTRKYYPFVTNGRLRFTFTEDGNDIKVYAYDIAYCCYMGIVSDPENIYVQMQNYLCNKSKNKLSIDHIDSNLQNNTMHNITLMTEKANSNKNNVMHRVKIPNEIGAVCVDGIYKVRIKYYCEKDDLNKIFHKHCSIITPGSGEVIMRVKCYSASDFVECLRMLTTVNCEWCAPLKDKKGWRNNKNKSKLENVKTSLAIQKEIVSESNDLYDDYSKEELI